MIAHGDMRGALERRLDRATTLLKAGSGNPVVTYPDETSHIAASKMLQRDLGCLPVVDRNPAEQLPGLPRPCVRTERPQKTAIG